MQTNNQMEEINSMFDYLRSETDKRPSQNGLNPMQLHLIGMLNFNDSEEAKERLQKALYKFYLDEFEREKQAMFASEEITEELIETGAKKHFRTEYCDLKL